MPFVGVILINKTIKKPFCFAVFMMVAVNTAIYKPAIAFDENITQQLSEQNSRKIDVELFNELYNLHTNTNRCGVDTQDLFLTFRCRSSFFHMLALEGHDVADVINKLYKPENGDLSGDLNQFSRLHTLAKRGNKSALCFSEYILSQIPKSDTGGWPYSIHTESAFTKSGAALGLPVCSYITALHYLNGMPNTPKDEEMALKYMLQAAILGIYPAQSYLAQYYQKLGVSDPNSPLHKLKLEELTVEEMIKIKALNYVPQYKVNNIRNVRSALCWGRLADKHKLSNGIAVVDILKRAAEDEAYVIVHPEYIKLANTWDVRVTSFLEKPTKAEDCITIEGEKK